MNTVAMYAMQHVTQSFLPMTARGPARKHGFVITATYSAMMSVCLMTSVAASTKTEIMTRERAFCHQTAFRNAPAMAMAM